MMMKRLVWTACVFAIVQTSALAQTLTGDRLRIGAGSCVLEGLYGPPNEVQMRNCTVLSTQGSDNMTLKPGGDLVLSPTGSDVLPNTGYSKNLGAITNKFLTIHAAELWIETLVAQETVATIGGRIIVGPTTTLTRDLSSATYTGSYPTQQTASFCVKHNSFRLQVVGVELGSKLLMESDGKFEAFTVLDQTTPTVTGSGDYCYTVYRNQDNTGTNDWYAGDAVVDTGKTGDGFLDLYSLHAITTAAVVGPTIAGNVRGSGTWNDWSARWAIGNLKNLYGYAADTYGAAFGNPSATNVTVDATNGFRIRSGTTNKLQADTSGNLSLTGDLSLGTAGVFRVNATAYGTGNGIWIDYNSGTPRFRIGNPAGNRLEWDGSALSVYGNGSGLTSIDGGQITANTINVSSINATGFGGNLVRNGRFEGANSTAGLSGWYLEEGASAPTWGSSAGPDGPGYLSYAPGNGNSGCVAYRATPVFAGQKYRARALVATNGGSTTVGFHVLVFESTSTSSVRNIVLTGASSPDVNRSSYTALAVNVAGTGGWQDVEYTYTAPSGVLWAALGVCDVSGSVSGSTYRDILLDGVEFQEQVGAGHIKANSITAGQIAAGTITATQIAAGTITATQIASGTITAGNIASGTITSGQIAAGTITASNIASGTITGDLITGTTLTLGGSIEAVGFDTTSGQFSVDSGGNVQMSGGFADGAFVFYSTLTADSSFFISGLAGGGTRAVCVNNGGQIVAC